MVGVNAALHWTETGAGEESGAAAD